MKERLSFVFVTLYSVIQAEPGTLQAEQVSDWAMFVGRFHPLIVHLPIGFVVLLAALYA